MSGHAQPIPMTARPGQPLTGTAHVPGDKSISHRSLILGALSVGETRVTGLLEGEDVLDTAKAMRAFGATVERQGEVWSVHGVGVGGFGEPGDVIDCGNSGTGVRLIMGCMATTAIAATFTGDVVAVQGENVTTAESLVVDLNTNAFQADGRVRGVIFPNQK